MNLFNVIAATTLIAPSLVFPHGTEANNGWFFVGISKDGSVVHSRSAGCVAHVCTSITRYSLKNMEFVDKINCHDRTRENRFGETFPIVPGSNAEFIANRVCR